MRFRKEGLKNWSLHAIAAIKWKIYNFIDCSPCTRIISLLNFHPLGGDFCFYATFLQLLSFFLLLSRLCIPLFCNAAQQIMFAHEIVTQTEMSCCPVAVKLGVESFILVVFFKSLRVGVYCVISFSLSVLFVTFLQTYFRYFWKHNVLVLMI